MQASVLRLAAERTLASLTTKVSRALGRRKYAPSIEIDRAAGLVRLGSDYGGWTFEHSPDLYDSTIVSCGLGEDASFDVEFASRFRARVIVVDPTPRAIRHFEEIQDRIGQPAIRRYAKGGKQPASSYDLSTISKESLVLEPSALWVENTELKFFAPANPDHVSHSIVNYQNNYAQDTAYIEVAATTPETLFTKYQLRTMPLMKLDIEGAELDVIRHLMERSLHPRQLLVEFDEMNYPSPRSRTNVEQADGMLRQAGYRCRHFDGQANFLYVR